MANIHVSLSLSHTHTHTCAHAHARTREYNMDKDMDALQHKLNRVMKQLHIWSQNNNLLINTEKTTAILFHFIQSDV
jgi:hypothetical protein